MSHDINCTFWRVYSITGGFPSHFLHRIIFVIDDTRLTRQIIEVLYHTPMKPMTSQEPSRTQRGIMTFFAMMMLISVTAPIISTASAGGGGGGGATTHPVEISNTFTPNNLTINMGDSVEWTNVDSNSHTVTDMGTGPETFDSGNINQGGTFSVSLQTPGTYDYQCNYHTSMTGVIHVIDPNGGGTGSDGNNSTGGGDENNTNGTGGNGGNGPQDMRMMVYMPDGTQRATTINMTSNGTLWDASLIGFEKLELEYGFDEDPELGVLLYSIAGMMSEVPSGEENYWFWSLYLLDISDGSWAPSIDGVSFVNASSQDSFAWVATNGSWGPFDGSSVDQMIIDNENNNNGGDDNVSVSMMIYMPDGTSQFSNFSVIDSANAWNASEMGFALLGHEYDYSIETYGVYLVSIGGLVSAASWGDADFWYWALYTTNTTTNAWESSMLGVSSINVEEGLSFAWVATNGSFGPNENSVDQMMAAIAASQSVEGCMDSTATNFNADATIDDSSCIYPNVPVLGCVNSTATNYNAQATEDDNSCTYPAPEPEALLGCMDSTASNFNAEATEDDGSCQIDLGNSNTSNNDNNDGSSDDIE
ncbi:MAG TPA: hypothetical protein EYG04_06225, partial [Candidatus Poseidoniales archaeon]|nr:hypothetical protein [Candidatus Poseidoniales archaeon]